MHVIRGFYILAIAYVVIKVLSILHKYFVGCHHDKLLFYFILNLSAAHLLRKTSAWYCVKPFCGALATENFLLILHQTFLRRTYCGKLSPDIASNLSAAHLLRKSFAWYCVKPFCGALTAENFLLILHQTFLRCTYCGKLSPDIASNLSEVHLLRKSFAWYCVKPFCGALATENFHLTLRSTFP